MKIAFFIPEFPSLYETFIVKELYYLQKSGIEGHIFYGRLGPTRNPQPVVHKISYHHTHIYQVRKLLFRPLFVVRTQWYLLKHFPRHYLQAFTYLLSIFSYINLRHFIRASLFINSIRKKHIDLLYIHDSEGITLIGIFCKLLSGLPCGIIFHTYGLYADSRLLQKKIVICEFSLFQSEYSKNHAYKIIQPSQEIIKKMHVISSTGVDIDFFSPISPRSKNYNLSRINIISIGRLEKMKGFDRLIGAVMWLKQNGMKVQCTIVGNGSQYHALRSLISNLRLENDIKLPGEIGHNNKLLKIMSSAELFVLPSVVDNKGDRDMQPNVIKEAMAMELLIITVKLGGIDEVITDKVCGFLLPSAGIEDIAYMIERVWKLPLSVKDKIRKNARRVIVDRYEARKINAQLISLFTKYSYAQD